MAGMLNPFLAAIQSRPVSRRRKLAALVIAIFNDTVRLLCGGTICFLNPIDDVADAPDSDRIGGDPRLSVATSVNRARIQPLGIGHHQER